MKTHRLILSLVLLALLNPRPLCGGDKSRYDIASNPAGLARVTAVTSPGWMLRGTYLEASLLKAGYFTLGTVNGLSPSGLDTGCTITYGHPFALTSYPVFEVDGVWGKPEKFFDLDSARVLTAPDSLGIEYHSGALTFLFSLRIGADGKSLILGSSAENRDTLAHVLGFGLVMDPALGPRGDGVVRVNQHAVDRDTMISGQSLAGLTWEVCERASAKQGMRFAPAFPLGIPSSVGVENWTDDRTSEAPGLSGDAIRALYDVVLRWYWESTLIAPGEHRARAVEIDLLVPNFGTTAFLRWDLPAALTIHDGQMFPATLSSVATAVNVSATGSSGDSVRIGLPPEVDGPSAAPAPFMSPGAAAYVKLPLSVHEMYEGKVVNLLLTYWRNGQPLDSLRKPLFIPPTPVADTGLVVTIDSIGLGAFPHINVFFEATNAAKHQRINQLAPQNVFLYDDGSRVADVALAHDTTGGSTATDIVFVLDVTGSMSDEIDGVKTNIEEFADSLNMRGVDYRLGMVTFLDAIESVYDFTFDPLVFKGYVAAQYAHGGDDEPENSLDALFRASQMTFRPNAKRIFIWITDATYHVNDGFFTARTVTQVVGQLLSQDVVVDGIGPAFLQASWFDPIVGPTGGKFFDIVGKFRDILLDISRIGNAGRFVASFTASVVPAGAREVAVEVHYAGLGGKAVSGYTAPVAGPDNPGGLRCYPNPFNPLITLEVHLPALSRATVTVYSMLGQEVRRFSLGPASGTVRMTWDATDMRGRPVASGMYIIRSEVRSAQDRIVAHDVVKVIHMK